MRVRIATSSASKCRMDAANSDERLGCNGANCGPGEDSAAQRDNMNAAALKTNAVPHLLEKSWCIRINLQSRRQSP